MQSTIDTKEQERFNQLAKTWWDTSGPMWPLHLLNNFRTQKILQVLAEKNVLTSSNTKPLQGLTALDIGCGGGVLSETICKLGAKVTAIDIAENNILIAKQHAKDNGLEIDYRHCEASQLQQQFDLVFNMEVVEHVANLNQFMQQCGELLKPGGITFVATINRTLKSYLFAILGAEYILRLLPKGTHQWSKFVTPTELNGLLQHSNCDTFWSAGVSLNPFTKKFSQTPSQSVNYMLAAQKRN